MNDTTDPTASHRDSATGPTGGTLSVNEASDRLGISPDAVRARIRRGTLRAEKRDNVWAVFLSETTRHDDHGPAPRQTATDPTVVQGTDLAPLTALLADVMKQNADLAAAAAVWQDRATHLEERLRQLETGERTEAPQSAGENANVETYRSPTDTGATGLLAMLKRLLRRSD